MTEPRLSPSTNAWTLTGLIALAIALVTLTRLLPYWVGMDHPMTQYLWNFTQVPALLLFGVALFQRRWVWLAFLLPILAMVVSDVILATTGYAEMGGFKARATIYGTLLLVGCLGFWLRHRRGAKDVISVSLASSLLFFFVTNFILWAGSNPLKEPPLGYEKSFAGLIECYAYGLPFFRNELLGNLFYCGILFGGYALAERWRLSREPAEVKVQR